MPSIQQQRACTGTNFIPRAIPEVMPIANLDFLLYSSEKVSFFCEKVARPQKKELVKTKLFFFVARTNSLVLRDNITESFQTLSFQGMTNLEIALNASLMELEFVCTNFRLSENNSKVHRKETTSHFSDAPRRERSDTHKELCLEYERIQCFLVQLLFSKDV